MSLEALTQTTWGKVVFVLIRICNVHCKLCVGILLLRAPPEIMGQRLFRQFWTTES